MWCRNNWFKKFGKEILCFNIHPKFIISNNNEQNKSALLDFVKRNLSTKIPQPLRQHLVTLYNSSISVACTVLGVILWNTVFDTDLLTKTRKLWTDSRNASSMEIAFIAQKFYLLRVNFCINPCASSLKQKWVGNKILVNRVSEKQESKERHNILAI